MSPSKQCLVWGYVILSAAVCALVMAEEGPLIADMDTVFHKPPVDEKTRQPKGTCELVEGRFGKAVKFSFTTDSGGFFTGWRNPTANWDEYAGFSFWVKGDGSKTFGCLELIDGEDYGKRYGVPFSLADTEWRKVTVPWCDVIPEIPKGDLVDVRDGYKPSAFRNLWVGKFYYWRHYPQQSFCIDEIRLEKSIPVETKYCTPEVPGVARVVEKLKAGRPVTIVTMGDSLTDFNHWANKPVAWPKLLVEGLKKRYPNAEIALVNPAIGGTQLSQNLILMEQNVVPHKPDLVTVCFGYNDYDGGMRKAQWVKFLRFGVDRIRRLTEGRADVLLLTTCPAATRWEEMKELSEGAREVAAGKKTGLADVEAAFLKAGAGNKERLYCSDKVHLGPEGHALVAETVLDALK